MRRLQKILVIPMLAASGCGSQSKVIADKPATEASGAKASAAPLSNDDSDPTPPPGSDDQSSGQARGARLGDRLQELREAMPDRKGAATAEALAALADALSSLPEHVTTPAQAASRVRADASRLQRGDGDVEDASSTKDALTAALEALSSTRGSETDAVASDARDAIADIDPDRSVAEQHTVIAQALEHLSLLLPQPAGHRRMKDRDRADDGPVPAAGTQAHRSDSDEEGGEERPTQGARVGHEGAKRRGVTHAASRPDRQVDDRPAPAVDGAELVADGELTHSGHEPTARELLTREERQSAHRRPARRAMTADDGAEPIESLGGASGPDRAARTEGPDGRRRVDPTAGMRSLVHRLSLEHWAAARATSAETLRAIAAALRDAGARGPRAERSIAAIEASADDIESAGASGVEQSRRTREGLDGVVKAMGALVERRGGAGLRGWVASSRAATQGVKTSAPFELQRPAIQDAFRAATDAMAVIIERR